MRIFFLRALLVLATTTAIFQVHDAKTIIFQEVSARLSLKKSAAAMDVDFSAGQQVDEASVIQQTFLAIMCRSQCKLKEQGTSRISKLIPGLENIAHEQFKGIPIAFKNDVTHAEKVYMQANFEKLDRLHLRADFNSENYMTNRNKVRDEWILDLISLLQSIFKVLYPGTTDRVLAAEKKAAVWGSDGIHKIKDITMAATGKKSPELLATLTSQAYTDLQEQYGYLGTIATMWVKEMDLICGVEKQRREAQTRASAALSAAAAEVKAEDSATSTAAGQGASAAPAAEANANDARPKPRTIGNTSNGRDEYLPEGGLESAVRGVFSHPAAAAASGRDSTADSSGAHGGGAAKAKSTKQPNALIIAAFDDCFDVFNENISIDRDLAIKYKEALDIPQAVLDLFEGGGKIQNTYLNNKYVTEDEERDVRKYQFFSKYESLMAGSREKVEIGKAALLKTLENIKTTHNNLKLAHGGWAQTGNEDRNSVRNNKQFQHVSRKLDSKTIDVNVL